MGHRAWKARVHRGDAKTAKTGGEQIGVTSK